MEFISPFRRFFIQKVGVYMKNIGLMRYFQEYLFYEAVEALNEKMLFDNKAEITVSQARMLRKKVLDEFDVKSFEEALDQDNLKEAIDDIFVADFGEKVFADSDLYVEAIKNFKDYTGVDSKRPVSLPVLPISPYDGRFSQFTTVMDHAPDCLFLRDSDIEKNFGGSPENLTNSKSRDAFFNSELLEFDSNANMYKTVGSFGSLDDLTGMAKLMPYIDAKDYRKAADWLSKVPAEERMTADGLNRATAVLQYLKDSGFSYELTTDSQPGQLSVRLLENGITVRIADKRSNEHFIGRSYDNGTMIYYSTNHKDSGNKFANYKNPTPEECVNLLKFRLGHPVAREMKVPNALSLAGTAGTYDVVRRGKVVKNNMAYLANDSFSTVFKNYTDENGNVTNDKVLIYMKGSGKTGKTFLDNIDAEKFLREGVETARLNLSAMINVDKLIEDFEAHGFEEDFEPQYHADPAIESVQRDYYALLSGQIMNLVKPSAEYEEYLRKLNAGEELSEDELSGAQKMLYGGDVKEQIKAHLHDYLYSAIGSYDTDVDNKRFDPLNVARFMDGGSSVYKNNEDILAALKICNISAEELRGNTDAHNIVKDNLIRFDVSTAIPMKDHESPLVRKFAKVVYDTIRTTGCIVDEKDIQMDDNGIVHYTARRIKGVTNEGKSDTVNGFIGQIFVPDERGVLETKFAGSKNYLSVPGYEAYILPNKPGENKSLEERTRLRGYEQIMTDQIRYTIRKDLTNPKDTVGRPISVNKTYRRLYDTRHDLDYFDKAREDGMPKDWQDAIIKTEARRVKYLKEYQQGSTVAADFLSGYGDVNPRNDNHTSPYIVSGGRNMAILSTEGDGYFDPLLTAGSVNQGTVRFLTESAVVNSDGSIVRGDLSDQAPMMKHPDMAFSKFDPFDRVQMVTSNIFQASSITDAVGVSCMALGGWNMDDGVVVSKAFAEAHKVRGAGDKLRTMVVGDKISDFHGNKGTIALVVDPDMDMDTARKEKLEDIVEIFKKNPDLSVVMAPYAPVSRYNGGSTRELMQNTKELVRPKQGDIVPGGIGHAKFIVTHMSVDVKTKIYDEDAFLAGKGRKASSQLAWALNAYDAKTVLQDMYSSNNKSVTAMREYLIVCGLDMDGTGHFKEEYAPQGTEDRLRFKMPKQLRYTENAKGTVTLDTKTMTSDFMKEIRDNGGFLELPFPLTYPTGKELKKNENGTYDLPVLSAHLRTGQDFSDGTSSTHDYTSHYNELYANTIKYLHAQSKLSEDKESYEKKMQDAKSLAQYHFGQIYGDVIARQFSGKHNIVRDGIMSNRLPNSATAVVTADPRLPLDEIGISKGMSKAINVRNGENVIMWRDPMLRKEGLASPKVRIIEDVFGVRINPVSDKRYDMDFDGDSVGACKAGSPAAREEANKLFGYAATLLDSGTKCGKDGNDHEFAFNLGLDMKVAMYNNPKLKENIEKLQLATNAYERKFAKGECSFSEIFDIRNKVLDSLSSHVIHGLKETVGEAVVRYDSMESHLKSLEHACLETGAKGNLSKFRHYMNALGVSDGVMHGDEAKTTPIQYDNLVVKDVTGFTREMHMDTEYATATKSFGTGVAGMYSQRGMACLRNKEAASVLELTYVATQSLLQAKHDYVEARHKYEILMTSARNFWRGYKMEYNADSESYVPVLDKNGKPQQAEKNEWIEQMKVFYDDKNGMNVSVHGSHFEKIANILADDKGFIRSIEREGLEELAAPMDKIAYGGDFKTIVDLAAKNAGLFEGEYNACFAPKIIQKNMNLDSVEIGGITITAPEKALVKSDTVEFSEKRATVNKKSRTFASKLVNAITPKLSEEKTLTSDMGISEKLKKDKAFRALVNESIMDSQKSLENDDENCYT